MLTLLISEKQPLGFHSRHEILGWKGELARMAVNMGKHT